MKTSDLEFSKIWEDGDMFELNILARSPCCQLSMDIYSTNDQLQELRDGLVAVSRLKTNEFI